MAQSNAQRTDDSGEQQEVRRGGNRRAATFKQGGVDVSVWRNGDMYNATIRNSYKDQESGEWKDTSSFSPADLAVASQLTSQAFQEIVKLKQQGRGR